MEHSVTGGELLAPFAESIFGRTLVRLWRLAATTADGSISLLGTLVLESTDGLVVLSYSQAGLSCRGPVERSELRWDVEPELTMDHPGPDEEWLDLVPLEREAVGPQLPLTVTGLTGWFGVSSYTETFAIALRERGRELLIATTDEFELVCTTRAQALDRANLIVTNLDFTLVDATVGT